MEKEFNKNPNQTPVPWPDQTEENAENIAQRIKEIQTLLSKLPPQEGPMTTKERLLREELSDLAKKRNALLSLKQTKEI